jgi:hypothetical protein
MKSVARQSAALVSAVAQGVVWLSVRITEGVRLEGENNLK